MNLGQLQKLSIALLFLAYRASAYSPLPRWGQATVIVDDMLYVHGGMTDEFNSYSYTSAPTSNELIVLQLSSSFSVSEPPWELVSGSSNLSTSQGPNVAWHAISAMNTSTLLLFGGIPDANSPPPVVTRPDSSWILDIFSRLVPGWSQPSAVWANQPIRRIHHTTVSSISGKVYLFGGELADGSDTIYPHHYVFDPAVPSFDLLPTANAPAAITGHSSIMLSNGSIVVFGGSSGSALYPFSTIWALDTTQSTPVWSPVSVSTDSLPTPRRAFASALLPDNKILIHGGSDNSFQTTYSDGWILDTSQSPMTWSQVEALSQVGARRDHFAVPYAGQIIFGFGYGASGPVSADLVVYDTGIQDGGSGGGDDGGSDGGSGEEGGGSNPGSGTIVPTFYPISAGSTPTQTIPRPTQTRNTDITWSITPTDIGVSPTSSADPGGDNGSSDGSPAGNEDGKNNKKTTAIAVGTAFAILAFLVAAVFVLWYIRRRRRVGGVDNRFMALSGRDDDGGDSPRTNLPMAWHSEKRSSPGATVLRTLGISKPFALIAAGTRRTPERRDMLVDEDTRDFGPWSDQRGNGSSWSLMSFLGGGSGKRTREASASSLPSATRVTPWREKSDPFSDGAALLRDEESGYIGAAVPGPSGATRERRQMSYGSSFSGVTYDDPFSDPLSEDDSRRTVYRNVEDRIQGPRNASPSLHLETMLPISNIPHVLSPVTETSRNTLSVSDLSSQGHSSSSQGPNSPGIASSSHSHSPFDSLSAATSRTSYSPRTTSIIDQPKPLQPMRRSDSWWDRFSRTSFLDRRGSDRRRTSEIMADFRDPNPPPRLVAIEESQNSGSPEGDKDSPGSQRMNSVQRGQAALARMGSRVLGTHRKSVSSFQTADSEAIERMGGMDVVVRERTGGSNRTRESTATSLSVDADPRWIAEEDDIAATFASPVDIHTADPESSRHAEDRAKSLSPSLTPPATQTLSSAGTSTASLNSSGTRPSPRPSSGTSVAARVQNYERQTSQELIQLPPTNTKSREERPRRKSRVDYGLVPRPSLFVANPDHRVSYSGGT